MNSKEQPNIHIHNQTSRRNIFKMAGAGALGITLGSCATVDKKPARQGVVNGRIKQSIAYWCFQNYWGVEKTCRVAKHLGCKSIELIDSKFWPVLRNYGLISALHGSHRFDKGLNNPQYHVMCTEKLRESIDKCSEYGFPNVITFTGFREDIPDDEGIENCVSGYKKIIGHAEKKKVILCLEILNSRVDIEMKGHPGYQGDHVDYCIEIIKRVGSPNLKLLFDIYNVQIMDGDIIARIRQYKDYIGHYQTAGIPGRNEINDKQEINYKAVMEEITRTGYYGYVGHEFIPTRDPLKSLREAVILCDV